MCDPLTLLTCFSPATEGTKKKEGIPQAVAAMKERGGSIQYVSKHELNLVTDNKAPSGLHLVAIQIPRS